MTYMLGSSGIQSNQILTHICLVSILAVLNISETSKKYHQMSIFFIQIPGHPASSTTAHSRPIFLGPPSAQKVVKPLSLPAAETRSAQAFSISLGSNFYLLSSAWSIDQIFSYEYPIPLHHIFRHFSFPPAPGSSLILFPPDLAGYHRM